MDDKFLKYRIKSYYAGEIGVLIDTIVNEDCRKRSSVEEEGMYLVDKMASDFLSSCRVDYEEDFIIVPMMMSGLNVAKLRRLCPVIGKMVMNNSVCHVVYNELRKIFADEYLISLIDVKKS